jgi:hypothetical protein
MEAIASDEQPGPTPFIAKSRRKARADAVWGTRGPERKKTPARTKAAAEDKAR